MFFLTEPDTERLNIRGSRDPLGLVPLWGSFGRKVVCNLTTASATVRGFTTALLALHFAEQIGQSATDREKVRLATFLKFEQLAGYARWIRHEDGNLRGISEVKRRTEEARRRIPIGVSPDVQILSSQKAYGLWGLYLTASVDSGLLLRQGLTLTPVARDFVARQYLARLRECGLGDGALITDLLKHESTKVDPEGRHSKVFDWLGLVLAPAFGTAEQSFYREHLLVGGERGRENGWQPRFVQLVDELPTDRPFDHDAINAVIRSSGPATEDAELHQHLTDIRELEALLVAMDNLFGFLQGRDRATASEVVKDLADKWGSGLRHLQPARVQSMQGAIAGVYQSTRVGSTFGELALRLHDGDFLAAIELVLDHNRFVMKERQNAEPWLTLSSGRIEVRYRDRSIVSLATPAELRTAWQSGFYLNPLKQISDELHHAYR